MLSVLWPVNIVSASRKGQPNSLHGKVTRPNGGIASLNMFNATRPPSLAVSKLPALDQHTLALSLRGEIIVQSKSYQ